MKVALVHDWLIHMRGGEKVLEALAELYPDAVIYTLFYDRKKLSEPLKRMKIKASYLQRLPGIRSWYRWLLPILPHAVRSLKLEGEDLVISSSHCVAKGVRVPPRAYHVCYCHTPARYLWGFEDIYFEKFVWPVRLAVRSVLGWLRRWDTDANRGVHRFVANSKNVEERIMKYYGREARVVYPPADTEFFTPAPSEATEPARDYYLVVSAFVPYKRVDVVIEAFNELDRRLIIVGGGPLEDSYRSLRKSTAISFVGNVAGEELRRLYRGARALVFPTEEDFGIVPVEAQACGTPVIAYGRGGALEGVKIGIFFSEQTPAEIRKAVLDFETKSFDRAEISAQVASFSKDEFKRNLRMALEDFKSEQGVYARH